MTVSLTIAEAAEASGVSAHTLRYYERAGLLDPVDRVTSGHPVPRPGYRSPTGTYSRSRSPV